MTSPLRELLEKEAGWEEFRMVIPNPFLPPRYRKISHGHDMIVLLDRDLTLHVRWEGSRIHEHRPLTPRATQRLIQECLDRMTKYRRELQVFSKFIKKNAEQPFDDPRTLDPIRFKEREPLPAEPIQREECQTIKTSTTKAVSQDRLGGESPLPRMEDFGCE